MLAQWGTSFILATGGDGSGKGAPAEGPSVGWLLGQDSAPARRVCRLSLTGPFPGSRSKGTSELEYRRIFALDPIKNTDCVPDHLPFKIDASLRSRKNRDLNSFGVSSVFGLFCW